MGLASQKIVIVRRATRLQGLKRKFATVAQAEFLMDRALDQEAFRKTGTVARRAAQASAIADYRSEDTLYQQAMDRLQKDLHGILPIQLLDREMLPTYLFGPADVVITVGQDGLVANTAKYVHELPIIAINPDPQRFDGVLLPFRVEQARSAVLKALEGRARTRKVTMARVDLPDGQSLLAFNDFFVGARSHVSARYRIEFAGHSERHSSSGVIVSTGAGSTGWLSSVFNMAAGLAGIETDAIRHAPRPKPIKLTWEDPRLLFVVREPFVSKSSAAGIVSGTIAPGQELVLESQMPSGGVIFSDGIESDFIEFNSGTIARIHAAEHYARLVS
jgi:NAD kinase